METLFGGRDKEHKCGVSAVTTGSPSVPLVPFWKWDNNVVFFIGMIR